MSSLKSEICTALTQDISNCERQNLKKLCDLIDAIILDKFKIDEKDYDRLYREVVQKLARNPNNLDAKLLSLRIKNKDVTTNGFVYMKFLEIKLILKGYNNEPKIVELIDKINNGKDV